MHMHLEAIEQGGYKVHHLILSIHLKYKLLSRNIMYMIQDLLNLPNPLIGRCSSENASSWVWWSTPIILACWEC